MGLKDAFDSMNGMAKTAIGRWAGANPDVYPTDPATDPLHPSVRTVGAAPPPAPAAAPTPSNILPMRAPSTDEFMPHTQSVLRMSGNDAQAAMDSGNYGAAVGHVARGALAGFPALAADVIGEPGNVLGRSFGTPNADDFAKQAESGLRTFQTGTTVPVGAPAPVAVGDASLRNPVGAPLPNTLTDVQRGGTSVPAPAPVGIDVGGNIRRFDQPGKAPLFTNLPGDGVSNTALMNRGEISPQNQLALDGIQSRQDAGDRSRALQAQQSKEEQDAAATNAAGGFGTGGVQLPGGIRGALERQLARGPMTAKGGALAAQLANVDATLAGHQMNHAATLRGQDIQREGHFLTNDTAHTRLQYDMNKDNRDHGFNVLKHNDEQNVKFFEQRQKAKEDLHKEIMNTLPEVMQPDGKMGPDTTTAARYTAAITAKHAELANAIAAKAATGDPKAIADLQTLKREGVGALGPDDRRAIIQGMTAKNLSDQYGSAPLNPIGGTPTITDELPSSIRKTPGFLGTGLGSEYQLLDQQGRPTGATVPSRAVEGDGSFIGGKRRTDLRTFMQPSK